MIESVMIRRIHADEFARIIDGATVLAGDPKISAGVARRPDRRIVKIFRARGLLSSNTWRPYAVRFASNARELARRGVTTVTVDDVFRIRGSRRDAAIYRPVEGHTLRSVLTRTAAPIEVAEMVERYIDLLADLHHRGVFFRSLHFDNVVATADGRAAVIDVSDVRFRSRPLSAVLRARNFKPPLRYDEDRTAIERFGPAAALERYLRRAALAPPVEGRFLRAVSRIHPLFALAAREVRVRPIAAASA
jgi:hypothetical protein